MEAAAAGKEFAFLQGGGELGELTRNYDWSKTSLGALDQWPRSLRTIVGIILSSKFPMFLWWGSELVQLYNDAYRPSLGNEGKHPSALGARGEDTWPEIWPIIKPLIDQVVDGGEATWSEDQLIPIYRNGRLEDVYWTFSYSPVRDDDGDVAGVLVTCTETTDKVTNMQQLASSNAQYAENKEQLEFAIEATELGVWDLNPATGKFTANPRLKEWFGLRPDEEIPLSLAVDAITEDDRQRVSDAIARALKYESGGHYSIEYTIHPPNTKVARLVKAKGRAWFGENKMPYRFNGTLQDITAEDKAKRDRSNAQALADLAVQSSRIGIFTITIATGQMDYTPETAAILTGDPDRKGLTRQAFVSLIHPDDAPLRAAAEKTVMETGRFDYAPRIIREGGSLHYLRIIGVLVKDNNGKPTLFSGTVRDTTEQRTARQKLEESEAHLQLLRDTVPAMIFYLDAEQHYQSYNKVFREWFGVAGNEAIGLTVREFIGDEAYAKTAPHLTVAYGGQQERYEMYAPSRMGVDRWLSIVYTPHKVEGGNVLGLIVHATDITQRKQTEMAIQESEARQRAIIQSAPVAISLFIGRDFIIENPNQPFIDSIGKGPDIIGKPLREVMSELASLSFFQRLAEVYDSGKPFSAMGIPGTVTKDGESASAYYNVSFTPLFDTEGKVYAILDVTTDVTEEIISRQKIEEAEQALRSAVDLAELGTWETIVSTGATKLSQRHADMFGLNLIETTAGEVLACVLEEDREGVAQAFYEAQQPGSEGKYEAEYRIVNARTGKQQLIHATGQTYFDATGKPVRIAGTAQDITLQRATQTALETEVQLRTEELAASNEELKATNEELAESNEALTHSNEELAQYAYVASHDLQEPLRKIRVFTGMLTSHTDIPDESKPVIAKISHSAERMSLLIKDLLDFSRLLKSDTLMRPVNLNELFAAVTSDFELIIQEKGAIITASGLPTIEAVSLQMNQLFYNLLSNSLKFTAAGLVPKIAINARLINQQEASEYIPKPFVFSNYYLITFTDNGIGFETQYTEQIFEVFKRLHGRDLYPGSGIGLALCRRIVDNHHGYLYATSMTGQGSQFHIILPDKQHDFTSDLLKDYNF